MKHMLLILGLVGLLMGCGWGSDEATVSTTDEDTLFVERAMAADGVFITVTPAATSETVIAETPPSTTIPIAIEPAASPALEPTQEATFEPTLVPTQEATFEPTLAPTLQPTFEPTPAAGSTPVVRQLVSNGCCVNPVWAANSDAIYFIDKPAPNAATGIYQVQVDGKEPVPAGELVTTTFGDWQVGGRFYVVRNQTGVTITEAETGNSWPIDSEGEQVTISPDGTLVTWQARTGNGSSRETAFWVANLDGSQARVVLRSRDASLVSWLNNNAMLLQKRDSDRRERMWWRYDPSSDSSTPLISDTRINGMSVSPDGKHLMYIITLEQDEPERNGFWLTNSETGETWQLPFVGGYRWRDASHLLLIPMEAGQYSHRLQEYDLTSNRIRNLTSPATHPFRVTNNDWAVSPDGTQVAFVSAADGNLWLIDLGN